MASDRPVAIVGIGASAGGLEALEHLFRPLPRDTGLAFVIVTHLARDRPSSMVELVGRLTRMPVVSAAHEASVEANHVYVAPPDQIVMIQDGRLVLQARSSQEQHKPIDVFLGSLGEDLGELAVGIVLSGGGSDGALGMKAIKERGGLTLAQVRDGHPPLQSSMPDTAIASGAVDLAIPVDQMADRLVEHAEALSASKDEEGVEETAEAIAAVRQRYQPIYRILLNQLGHDFSGYKERTFGRRTRRRMQVLQIKSLDRYIERLAASPEEVTLLFRDLLIGVTNFFRDSDAFEVLRQQVIPKLLDGRGANDTVRIWVPGCATGEEAYSIAILLREAMDSLTAPPKVQIFATDIDEAALSVARGARYPGTLLENVSPERRQRFFLGDDVSYGVAKEIRDMCIFSSHSVIRDPPFSRINLISCRNLLIYLGSEFQAQVVPVFHFALRPRGFLFLGTSENVSQHGDLFAPVDKRHRIFQRRDHVVGQMHLPMFGSALRHAPSAGALRLQPGEMTVNLRRAAEDRMMERFAPAHVIVNTEGDILHYSPRTGKYLEPAAGLPNRQLLAMARRGLRLDLRAALREAVETRRQAVRERIAVELDERVQIVNLTVDPFGDNDSDPLFMVVFADVGHPFVPLEEQARRKAEGDHSADRLEQELRDTRERLQATIEEYETAVEELKSSNEELQSINEELQSTNEELETSKEELQSVNEELHTVNAELNAKVDEVDRASADLQNLFTSTQIATIFLDRQAMIRSFTPAVTAIFNLISSDRGRPLADIVSHIKAAELEREIHGVLEQGKPIERNVRRTDGKAHYQMRILPYLGRNNLIEGALLTFVDITQLVEAEKQQRTLVEELNHRVRNMLAVVGAIANQTLAAATSSEDFAAAFTGRIRAMGTAYGLVSRENWSPVALREVLLRQLEPYNSEDGDRIHVRGPAALCAPAAALGLGLAVHELATNAAKYGGLSMPGGRVDIAWDVRWASAEHLRLVWREEGGPALKPPERKGFGTRFIERELEQSLSAQVNFEYASRGLIVTMSIPLDPARVALAPKQRAGA